MVTLGHYLIVSGMLFTIGFAGVLLRRNIIIIFMSLELMLNAANLSLVAFSRFRVADGMPNYNAQVFVFPPWREIYRTDDERRQGWAEAEATFERVLEVVARFGYRPVIVPRASVAERAAFVTEQASTNVTT